MIWGQKDGKIKGSRCKGWEKENSGTRKILYLYYNSAVQSIHDGSSPTALGLTLFLTLLHFNTPKDYLPPSSDAPKHQTFSANKFVSGFQSRCGTSTNTSFITSYFKSRHTLALLQQISSCRVSGLISTNQSLHKLPPYPPFYLLP